VSAVVAVFHRDGRPVDPALLDALTDAHAAVGADGRGTWRDGPVGLGVRRHRRGVAGDDAKQPLVSDDGRLALVADVRLDDPGGLCRALGRPPRPFTTADDAELVLDAYRCWGPTFVERLSGDLSLVLWDGGARRLLAVTGPTGSLPLHWAATGPNLYVSTSPVPLVRLGLITKRLDAEAFAAAFLSGQRRHLRHRTTFAGINALPAGSVLLADASGAHTHRYWRLQPVAEVPRDDAGCAERLRALIEEAVACRVTDPATTGTLLSGGLDSATLTCVTARRVGIAGHRLASFTSVLPPGHVGPEVDELTPAAAVAAHAGAVAHPVWPTLDHFAAHGRSLDALGWPDMRNDALYRALFAAAARRGVRTLLDGAAGEWGASAHGLGAFVEWLARGRWLRVGREAWTLASASPRGAARLVAQEMYWLARDRRPPGAPEVWGAYAPGWPLLTAEARRLVTWRPLPLRATVRDTLAGIVETGRGPRSALADTYGVRLSRPFEDPRVLAFCLALPAERFVHAGQRRQLIRGATAGLLPAGVRRSPAAAPFLPHYHHCVRAARAGALEILHDGRRRPDVTALVDIETVLRAVAALDAAPDWRPRRGVDLVRAVVEPGVHAVQYLRWFEAL
jgi:asparagine synthase (glutamine-hydrolysing)